MKYFDIEMLQNLFFTPPDRVTEPMTETVCAAEDGTIMIFNFESDNE